jgi:hypothetical protein
MADLTAWNARTGQHPDIAARQGGSSRVGEAFTKDRKSSALWREGVEIAMAREQTAEYAGAMEMARRGIVDGRSGVRRQ